MRLIREPAWLTEARAAAYCRILAIVAGVLLAGWIALGVWHGGIDPFGRPLGPDFAPYWTAAKLAAGGRPQDAYDPAVHFAAERALFAGAPLPGPTPFFYPPVFLLICLPFAALPYLAALLAWTSLTAVAAWAGVRRIWPRHGLALPVLVSPGLLINVFNGQNGTLSAAMFAAGALTLRHRPWLAGICYGCLAYKPHLALALPFALLPVRAWSAVLTGVATVALLASLSVAAFGLSTWQSFLAASTMARTVLEAGIARPERMASVFAAAQMRHFGLAAAYMAQAIVALGACAVLVRLRRDCPPLARGAAIAAAAPLISPYMFDYDLAVLLVPLAWVMNEAIGLGSAGFLPWEKIVLLAGFVVPVAARVLALHGGVPVAPLVSGAVLAIVVRRVVASPGSP